MIALLATICSLGRIIFSGIPNVQPVTALLIIFTVILGWRIGMTIATLTIILTNLFLGLGPWTIMQILSYWIVIFTINLIHKVLLKLNVSKHLNYIVMTIASGLMGFLYGFVISIMWVVLFRVNHFFIYYMRGIPYDLLHAMGNIVFYLILFPVMSNVLKRFEKL